MLSVDEADLKNIVEYGLESSYRFGQALSLGLTYASLPSPWGDGREASDDNLAQPGSGFGLAQGVDRQAYGVMSRYHMDMGAINAGFSRTAGSRLIGEDGYNPGFYQMETVVFSAGADFTF